MKNTLAIFIALLLLVGFMKLFNLSIPLSITQSNTSSELSVVGEGKVEVVPNVAYVDVGVTVNRATTSQAAQTEINTKNKAILDAMTKLGIDKKNIKTSNYSVYPMFNYDSGREVQDGYTGNVTITIKTEKVELVSDVVSAATAAGANQVQGTRFEVEDPAKYREEARAKAIANAKEQAQKIAKDLDIKLGKVVNVTEYSPSGVAVPMYAMEKSAVSNAGGGGPAVEPGTQTITTVVTLYFQKK